jgi:hypothetical protein
MRLFLPHIICAVIFTLLTSLEAYYLYTQMSLENYLMYWFGGFYVIGMSIIGWISAVRWIEYSRVKSIISPLANADAVKLAFIESRGQGFWMRLFKTTDAFLQYELDKLDFIFFEIQQAQGSSGRQRVVIAALAEELKISWDTAKKYLRSNQFTAKLGTSFKDYFWPGW